MFEHFKDQQADSYLNQTFEVHTPSHGVVEITLTETSEIKSGPAVSISLIFQGPKDRILGQSTYLFKHPSLGEFTLYMVPVMGQDPTVQEYQIVLSKLEEKQ
jgi:hypothetical protein